MAKNVRNYVILWPISFYPFLEAVGLGNYYGTLIGPGNMKAFSPATRPKSKQGEKKKNFYTNPGQKGTGYGYVKFSSHLIDFVIFDRVGHF